MGLRLQHRLLGGIRVHGVVQALGRPTQPIFGNTMLVTQLGRNISMAVGKSWMSRS
jgi:hypothetical protein